MNEPLQSERSAVGEHIVRSYDKELTWLNNAILEMGGVAEKMLEDALRALSAADAELAQAVIASDARLDQQQREVEERAVLTTMRRQPLANDLRQTVTAIRVSGDLERIGDLAKNIAKRALALGAGVRLERPLADTSEVAKLAIDQVRDVLDAYTQRNSELALDVWRRDGAIDALYTSLFRELLTYMMEDPRNITFCTHILFCAKNIERIGDHTTNIAETVHYLVTGENLSTDRPKNDQSSLQVV